MQVGALEADRWAGVVFSPSPGRGIGFRLAFIAPDGEVRDRGDWYWMASRVGPHEPDGSYARMEFDLGAAPEPASGPSGSTMVLEWARRDDALALRARVSSPGSLLLVGDAPWDWSGRWEKSATSPSWRARHAGCEMALAVRGASEADCECPGLTDGRILERLEVADSAKDIVLAASWGGDAASEALRLVGSADEWIDAESAKQARKVCGSTSLEAVISNNLVWTVLLQPETGRLYAPAGRRWMFPGPQGTEDWTIFGWDTFFNALLLARVSGELAWSALHAGIESRYSNGTVPNWRSRHRGTPDRSQPPVGSFAALRLHRQHPDRAALGDAYAGLLAWCDWWMADRNGRGRRQGISPGLLSWGSDAELVPPPDQVPPWEVGAGGRQRAAWESGQDDLPLWEEAEWDPDRQILAMSAVDLCSYRALDLECLAEIARILGDRRTARRLLSERGRLVEAMNRVLWCDARGLYLDELPGGRSHRVAASNFLPLVAGAPSRFRARRMVRTLRNPTRFWGEHVVPSISRDDPAFKDQQYWRGAIWPPMNYLVLHGLRRYGFGKMANELAWKGAKMFLADHSRTGMCRENFDAVAGRGCGQRFQSWSPLLVLGALEELESAF